MSTPQPIKTVTVTSHPANWQTIAATIFQLLAQTEPIFLKFLPADAAAGVIIATELAPIVVGVIEQLGPPSTAS